MARDARFNPQSMNTRSHQLLPDHKIVADPRRTTGEAYPCGGVVSAQAIQPDPRHAKANLTKATTEPDTETIHAQPWPIPSPIKPAAKKATKAKGKKALPKK